MRKKQDKDKAREAKERFYKKQRELGLCLECTNPAAEGGSRCAAHIERRRQRQEEKRKDAVKKGYCKICLARPALPHNKLCDEDYFRQASLKHFGTTRCWEQLRDLYEAQEGKCALSGVPLTLGLNTELDHIRPTSKQGCRDVANTQWVLKAVNRMKDNMLEGDFYDLVEALYKHMRKARR